MPIAFLSSILLGLLALLPQTNGASLTEVTNWGDNPSGIQMFTYVPNTLADNPAVIMAVSRHPPCNQPVTDHLPQLHPCGGSASQYYQLTKLPSYADQLGFILIYPQTTHDSNCWDVNTDASLTHDGGGDSQGLAAMVAHTLTQYTGDAARVFAAGSSSGAMMTNVLAATYPDVFAAGAAFSGVPARCLENATNSAPGGGGAQTCVGGQESLSAAEWGDLARECYPGYDGPWPRMQIWAGTADTLVTYPTMSYQLAQWSDVLDVAWTANKTNTPENSYTEMVYGDGTKLQGYSAAGVGHFVPFHEETVLQFFGLM
jgi:acetylxylan esterase